MISTETRQKLTQKMKTIGLIGFLFFFLKGMVWLALGFFLLK